MSNWGFNINLGYQKDRACISLKTNTLNGLLNPNFYTTFLEKTVLFLIKRLMVATTIVMVAIKRLMVATTIVMVSTKRLMVATTIVMVATKRLMVATTIVMVATKRLMIAITIVMVATKRLMIAITIVMVATKRLMVVIKRTFLSTTISIFSLNLVHFIACIILLLKKRIYVLASILASFALMANHRQTYVGHISNLKGYNKYADWFRTQW